MSATPKRKNSETGAKNNNNNNRSTKKPRVSAPDAPDWTSAVRRIYVAFPMDGSLSDVTYTLYTQPDATRSARVHAAAVALSRRSESRKGLLVEEFFLWIGQHYSIKKASEHVARLKASAEKGPNEYHQLEYENAKIVFEQFSSIDDAGREHDVVVYEDAMGLYFAYNNASEPVASVLVYPYTA